MRYLNHLGEYLLAWSIPGLFAIALLDSAAVPMAGGPDGVVILLAWQKPDLLPWIVLSACAGSVLGCLVLYRIGRAGGEIALARISQRKREWVKRRVESNVFWAVFLAVLVPPPFPTKPVILAAGVFRTPQTAFLFAAAGGRLLRYYVVGYLGSRFGDRAAEIIRSHYGVMILILAALTVLVLLTHRWMRAPRSKTPAINS